MNLSVVFLVVTLTIAVQGQSYPTTSCPPRNVQWGVPLYVNPNYEETDVKYVTDGQVDALLLGDVNSEQASTLTRKVVKSQAFPFLDTDDLKFTSIDAVLYTGVQDNSADNLVLEGGGDGQASQGALAVYLQTIETDLFLVDCLTATSSKYFVFNWYGKVCKALVNKAVASFCTAAKGVQNIDLVGINGEATTTLASVQDTISSTNTARVVFTAQEFAQATLSQGASFTTLRVFYDDQGNVEYQEVTNTSQSNVDVNATGDEIAGDVEVDNNADNNSSSSQISINLSSSSSGSRNLPSRFGFLGGRRLS